MVRMIQAFMEDYSEAANGLGFIQTSVEERKCLATLVPVPSPFHIVPRLHLPEVWQDP